MPRNRVATLLSLPGGPAGFGWRAGLGVVTRPRSIDASAEVVGKLAGGTEGGGRYLPLTGKCYESWILGGMGMAIGSSPSSISHSFATQLNSISCSQGLAYL